jgi:hypothetical protein
MAAEKWANLEGLFTMSLLSERSRFGHTTRNMVASLEKNPRAEAIADQRREEARDIPAG